ncbi:hypothetical protein CEP54_014946 [Fusarium duplospermum]|uniref:Uncharacterized protein n=1 Tax=Fusarium duplospermum TaxID=1325734 RepID=A0A428NSI9_9HYPO|nr:hypothetical protein CEP54_014946 [Fusarium duplospermum]
MVPKSEIAASQSDLESSVVGEVSTHDTIESTSQETVNQPGSSVAPRFCGSDTGDSNGDSNGEGNSESKVENRQLRRQSESKYEDVVDLTQWITGFDTVDYELASSFPNRAYTDEEGDIFNDDYASLAVDSNKDIFFFSITCAYKEGYAKMFRVKDIDKGIEMLKDSCLTHTVTSGEVIDCMVTCVVQGEYGEGYEEYDDEDYLLPDDWWEWE